MNWAYKRGSKIHKANGLITWYRYIYRKYVLLLLTWKCVLGGHIDKNFLKNLNERINKIENTRKLAVTLAFARPSDSSDLKGKFKIRKGDLQKGGKQTVKRVTHLLKIFLANSWSIFMKLSLIIGVRTIRQTEFANFDIDSQDVSFLIFNEV